MNNHVSNLEYGTRSQNERDKERHGTCNSGVRNGRSRFTAEQVTWIKRNQTRMSQKDMAMVLDRDTTAVWRVVNGMSYRK